MSGSLRDCGGDGAIAAVVGRGVAVGFMRTDLRYANGYVSSSRNL